MQSWFENGAADGFNVMPPVLPQSLNEFVELVVPELQRRGLFRTAYEGRRCARTSGSSGRSAAMPPRRWLHEDAARASRRAPMSALTSPVPTFIPHPPHLSKENRS